MSMMKSRVTPDQFRRIFGTILFSLLVAWFWSATLIAQLNPATASPPTFTKVFTPDTIGPGSVSTLTFTITNTDTVPITDMAFTDVLPTMPGDVDIATPANASTTCLLGVVTAPAGGGTITFSGGVLGVGETCTVSVDVTASTVGAHMNTSSVLMSSAPDSGTASDTLTVATDRPGFSKSFAPASVSLGGRSTLTFTIDNSLNSTAALIMSFTDVLPPGMVVAGPSNAATTCSFSMSTGVVTAVPGSSVISLSNGAVNFMMPSTCTVSVDVIGNAVGTLTNVSGELTSLVGTVPNEVNVSSGKASDALEVTVTPIALTKSFTDDPVPPGGTVTLEFTIISLDRTFPATSIAFTDVLPGGLSATGSMPTPPCGAGSTLTGTTTLTFAGGNLPAEGSCTFSVTLTAGDTPGNFTNTTSSITADVNGSMITGDPASEIVSIQPGPLLTKEFVGDPVNPGDDVILRFTITNTSADFPATAISFTDELTTFLPFPVTAVLPGAGTACGGSIFLLLVGDDGQELSLTGGSLMMPGEMCMFDVTLTIPAGQAGGTFINTTSEISALVDDVTVIGKPASDSLVVVAAPTLSKAFTDDPVEPGGTVTLEYTLTHSPDATDDADAISFTDDLAPVLAGLTANLPPTPDPPCGTGSMGDTLLTLMDGTLMPGQSCTFSVTLNVPAGAASGSHTNTTSSVSATIGVTPATSAAATDDLNVAGLTFTKEFIGDPVIAGDTVTLRFTIANVHPTDDATITFFTDSLSSALSGLAATGPATLDTCGGALSGTSALTYIGGSVMSGMTCTIEVPVLVPVGAADGTFLNVSSALVTSLGLIDPAVDNLTVDSNLLQLTKSFTDDPAVPGSTVTLQLIITNLDAANAASAIAFTDDLSAALSGLTATSVGTNTCSFTVMGLGTGMLTLSDGTVGMGGTCTLSLTLTLPAMVAGNSFVNTTSGLAGTINTFAVTGDPASDTLVVNTSAFTKMFGGSLQAGGTQTLTFTITNLDTSSSIADLVFSDNLDVVVSGLVAVAPLPTNPCGTGSTLSGTSLLTLTGANLAASGVCIIPVTVTVPSDTAAGMFTNTTSDLFQFGLTLAPPATATLTVETEADLSVTKDDGVTSAVPGLGTLTYTIVASNAGPNPDPSVSLTDTFPAVLGCTFTSVAAGGATGNTASGSGNLSETLSMPAGSSVTYTVMCTIDDAAMGTLSNTATIAGSVTDPTPGNNSATDNNTVLTAHSVPVFTKSFAPNPIAEGATTTLTLTIDNTANPTAFRRG